MNPSGALAGAAIALSVALGLGWTWAAGRALWRWLSHVRRVGGRVRTAELGAADFGLAMGMGVLLATVTALALFGGAEEQPGEAAAAEMTGGQLLGGMLVSLSLPLVPIAALLLRRVSLPRLWGFREVPPPQALAWGAATVASALPLMAITVGILNAALSHFLPKRLEEQELVATFREAVERGNHELLWIIGAMAVLAAPLIEETLFRGYLYPACKRVLGAGWSAVGTAVLFAAIHGNVAALVPLTVLALCFTLAYERTGSLLVPILGHALFNACSLGAMVLSTHLTP